MKLFIGQTVAMATTPKLSEPAEDELLYEPPLDEAPLDDPPDELFEALPDDPLDELFEEDDELLEEEPDEAFADPALPEFPVEVVEGTFVVGALPPPAHAERSSEHVRSATPSIHL